MKPDIKPVGIGDLIVVKQTLVRYAPGEVAHIENVMATESRGREHRRLRRTEETLVVEQEHIEESQRDLQSTERFELQQEVHKTIKSDTKFEVGAEVSGGFGPVQLSVNTEFSTSTSKTESDRKATEYAKEITEKSVSKLVDRVRQERTTKTIEEFEEKNFHKFENAAGENRTGVYRWVDKFYRVKVVNYGKRLFYEFVVPEPAAFYIFARTYNIDTNLLPTEPELPTSTDSSDPLTPEDVERDNFYALVSQYGAQGVTPPPRKTIRISRIIARELQSDQDFAFVDSELEIPAGYVKTYTRIRYSWNGDSADFLFQIHEPRRYLTQDASGQVRNGPEGLKTIGRYPVGARGTGLTSLMMDVTITCTCTDEAMAEWRLKTFQSIMEAYDRKRAKYEEQLAAAQIVGGVQIGGNNPLINRTIERDELKKACITLWTGFKYNGAPGIEQKPTKNWPEVNVAGAAAMRPEIKFLEQAFDWKNLTYEFYPYFWGRRTQWLNVYTLSDNDPLFADFLKAGAARVLVPVQPASTAQVLYYQLTGKLWSGGEVPQLDPPDPGGDAVAPGVVDHTEAELALYQDYVAELLADTVGDDIDREIDIAPDDPEAWMVKVPTTLVWLQPDATLPDLDIGEPNDG